MDATLLIADGPSPARDALEDFFSRCGFRVVTAGSGLECLEKARVWEPEVLVIDWELPRGGAAAVLPLLSEEHFEFEPPAVLLVIGDAPPAVLSEGAGVPRASCLQKPVDAEHLLDRVGLAIAWIDLHRNWEAPLRRRQLGRLREAEACLT